MFLLQKLQQIFCTLINYIKDCVLKKSRQQTDTIFYCFVVTDIAFKDKTEQEACSLIAGWFLPPEWGAQIAAFQTIVTDSEAYKEAVIKYGIKVVDFFIECYEQHTKSNSTIFIQK